MIDLRHSGFARHGAGAVATLALALVLGYSTEPGIARAVPGTPSEASVSVDRAKLATLPTKYQGLDAATSKMVDSDEYSDTFLNADGTFTDMISTEPINVERGGDWVPASDIISHDSSGWSAGGHPLSPEFASSANGVLTAFHGGSQITFRLEGTSDTAIQRVPGTTHAVQYENALDNADLRYETEGAAVKEMLVLNAAPSPGNTSWTWRIHASGLNLTKNEIGDLEFVDADGTVQFHIPAPVAWDSSGVDAVREPALISLQTVVSTIGKDYALTLSADAQWLRSQSRVYPVYVDPSLTAGDTNFHAYKSDGAVRTDAVHVGNTRESNTNKYWRTQSKYAYSNLAGKQVVDASLKVSYVSGTANAYTGGGIYETTCFGYSCYGSKMASVTVGSTYGSFSTDGLATYYALAVNAGDYGRFITSRGAETAGAYTYKQLNTSLTLTYKNFPIVTGLDGPSPANGANTTINTSLSVATVAPTGVQISTRYLVSLTPSFTDSTAAYVSDWAAPGTIDLADAMGLSPGTTYYWRAQVKDTYDGLYGISTVRTSPTWWFVTIDAPPETPAIAGIRPAQAGEQLLVGTAPTIGVYSADPDSLQLQSTVEVFADDGLGAPTARVGGCVSEYGLQPAVLECALDADALANGASYHLRAKTFDGNAYSGWSPWIAATVSNVVVEHLPDFVEKSLEYDHAVSLGDAIDVMDGLGYNVVGFEFQNSDLVGTFFPSYEYGAAEFLAGFAADYGTVPEITAVVVLAPTAQTVSAQLGGDAVPAGISTGRPVIKAPLADGTAIAEFNTAMDAAAFDDAQSTSGAVAMTTGSSGFSRWDPGTATTKIIQAGTSAKKLVQFVNHYYWNGTTSSPKFFNDHKTYTRDGRVENFFGLEFENNIIGTHYSDATIRCQVGFCTNYCDIAVSRGLLVAMNQGYSFAVHVKSSTGTPSTSALGAYADTNDVWDKCNRNSIAVGLQHPEKLPVTSATDPSIQLYISVTAAKGTDSSDKVGAQIQVVNGYSCTKNTNWSRTDCMGATVPFVFAFSGTPKTRVVLGEWRNWVAPNLCWKSTDYGGTKPAATLPRAATPAPWY